MDKKNEIQAPSHVKTNFIPLSASPGNIRSLILEKEKELHDINEYRIQTLETRLHDKETEVETYKQKMHKLQEDFKYNLKLLEGRDEELAIYDTNFGSLKNTVREREAELSEYKAQLAEIKSNMNQEHKKSRELELYYQQKMKDVRGQMEGMRWKFEDENRALKDDLEQSKRKFEKFAREQQEQLETQRLETSTAFDEMLRLREANFKINLEAQFSKIQTLELELKKAYRDKEKNNERTLELQEKVNNLQNLVAESEKELKNMEWRMADECAIKDDCIKDLEVKVEKLEEVKENLLFKHEEKVADLLQRLQSTEKVYERQKIVFEEELQHVKQIKNEELHILTQKLDETTSNLTSKLHATEERLNQALNEVKNNTWTTESLIKGKDLELDDLREKLHKREESSRENAEDLKSKLWKVEQENLSLQEKYKNLTTQLSNLRDREERQRQDLIDANEKQEGLKREIIATNLRWENKLQEAQEDMRDIRDQRTNELRVINNCLRQKNHALENKIVQLKNVNEKQNSEQYKSKPESSPRNFEFESFFTNNQAFAGKPGIPSPLWSEDNGNLSAGLDLSPNMLSEISESMQKSRGIENANSLSSHSRSNQTYKSLDAISKLEAAALSAENEKLKSIIRGMKDAIVQQSNSSNFNQITDVQIEQNNAELKKMHKELELMYKSLEEKLLQEKETNTARAAQCNELEAKLAELRDKELSLIREQVGADKLICELKLQLAAAQSDIEQLVQERTQLMELSNRLTADLRRVGRTSQQGLRSRGHSSTHKPDTYSDKKDHKALIAELSRSLEESHMHNKTLKKELRRMIKNQLLNAQGFGSVYGDQRLNINQEMKRSKNADNINETLQIKLPPTSEISIEDRNTANYNFIVESSTTSKTDVRSPVKKRISTLSMMQDLESLTKKLPFNVKNMQNRYRHTNRDDLLRINEGDSRISNSVLAVGHDEKVDKQQSLKVEKAKNNEYPTINYQSSVQNQPTNSIIYDITHGKHPNVMQYASGNVKTEEATRKIQNSSISQHQPSSKSLSIFKVTGPSLYSDKIDVNANFNHLQKEPHVSHARLKLEWAREKLNMAGQKASAQNIGNAMEIFTANTNTQKVTFSPKVATRKSMLHPSSTPGGKKNLIVKKRVVANSSRETLGQKEASQRLKAHQMRRSEMITERQKVRNYSLGP